MRFGSVYTEPFSPENPSCDGLSERAKFTILWWIFNWIVAKYLWPFAFAIHVVVDSSLFLAKEEQVALNFRSVYKCHVVFVCLFVFVFLHNKFFVQMKQQGKLTG